MLLNYETGSTRRERVLIAAEICRRARFAHSRGDLAWSSQSSAHDPDAEDIPLAVGYGDHAVRRNVCCPCDRLIDDRLYIRRSELGSSRSR